jgi:hypothetical protein
MELPSFRSSTFSFSFTPAYFINSSDCFSDFRKFRDMDNILGQHESTLSSAFKSNVELQFHQMTADNVCLKDRIRPARRRHRLTSGIIHRSLLVHTQKIGVKKK